MLTSWGPFITLDQRAIERIQRHATKLVIELKDNDYVERLQALATGHGSSIFVIQTYQRRHNISLSYDT